MIKILDLINEALPLSVAKQYSKGWNKDRLKDWFGGKSRVYLQLSSNVNLHPEKDNRIQNDVQSALTSKQYVIIDYQQGLAKNTKYDRTQKIGRVLQKIKPEILQSFNNDPARQTTKQKPIVCISRHPYDIAGMSTDRGWTSCKDLGTNRIYSKGTKEPKVGMYADQLESQVNKLLIAYLIYPDDTNIQYPIARINIIPYINIENPNDIKFDVSKMCYGEAGVNYNAFIKTVTDWLFKKQGALEDSEDVIYGIDPDIYNDNNPQYLSKNDNEVWKGGTRTRNWFGGTWKDGIWMAKIWLDGVWKKGTWTNGTWHGGWWYNGTWKNGTWKDGTWQNGIWEDGTWQYGRHFQGNWNKGTWEDGRWSGGNWMNGVWYDGKFVGGNWYNGTWKNGTWVEATWHNGTWQDGIWYHGTWKGGTWKGGWIQDGDKQGNFEKSWKWKKVGNVKLVRSPINPKEYFAKKKKTNV